jgi:hypothetical protein
MATLILTSLAAGYALVFLFALVVMRPGIAEAGLLFIAPIALWPATLIVAGLAFLVLLAILEHQR